MKGIDSNCWPYFQNSSSLSRNEKKGSGWYIIFLALTAIVQTTLEKIAMQLSDLTSINQMWKFEKKLFGDNNDNNNDNNNSINGDKDIALNFK